jgi:hypothetical protein
MMPGKPRFRAMDAEEAHLRQSLLGALCGVRVGAHPLRAHFPLAIDSVRAEPVDQLSPWFLCADDIAFRIVRLADRPVRLDPADGPAMALLLDAADSLLAALEDVLGLTLEPGDIGPRPGRALLIARIEGEGGEALIDLALPRDAALLPTPAPFAPAMLGHIPVGIRLTINGPRLPPADAAALARGDMLLLGPAPLAATLHLPAGSRIDGRLGPAERLFQPR